MQHAMAQQTKQFQEQSSLGASAVEELGLEVKAGLMQHASRLEELAAHSEQLRQLFESRTAQLVLDSESRTNCLAHDMHTSLKQLSEDAEVQTVSLDELQCRSADLEEKLRTVGAKAVDASKELREGLQSCAQVVSEVEARLQAQLEAASEENATVHSQLNAKFSSNLERQITLDAVLKEEVRGASRDQEAALQAMEERFRVERERLQMVPEKFVDQLKESLAQHDLKVTSRLEAHTAQELSKLAEWGKLKLEEAVGGLEKRLANGLERLEKDQQGLKAVVANDCGWPKALGDRPLAEKGAATPVPVPPKWTVPVGMMNQVVVSPPGNSLSGLSTVSTSASMSFCVPSRV